MQGMQEFFSRLNMFLEFVCVYFSTMLGFCVIISFLAVGIIMALRSTVFAGHAFGRGALWCMLIPVLFCGKIRAYYETRMGVKTIFRWYSFLSEHRWISIVYIVGMLIVAAVLIYRRIRLKISVSFMYDSEDHKSRYPVKVYSGRISSFCVGCLSPVIVVPESLTGPEADVVVKHEETHIRLGQLWILLAYDIIRILLWPNVFLHLCVRYLKRDLEGICDLVTIRRNDIDTGYYGRVILNCAKDMAENRRKAAVVGEMSFTREDNYKALKKRLEQIVKYKAYNTKAALAGVLTLVIAVCAVTGLIKANSYKRTNDMGEISSMCFGSDVDNVIVDYDKSVVTAFDDEYIYVDSKALQELYPESKTEDGWFYFTVGGFYKLPGIGGGGGWGELDAKDIHEGTMIIPNHTEIDIWLRLIMWL